MPREKTATPGFAEVFTRLPVVLQVAAVLVAVVNVWLAYKLAPLAQNIMILSNRVEAIEISQTRHDTEDEGVKANVTTLVEKVSNVEKKVFSIEAKVDRLLER